jgi:hypothetical protein
MLSPSPVLVSGANVTDFCRCRVVVICVRFWKVLLEEETWIFEELLIFLLLVGLSSAWRLLLCSVITTVIATGVDSGAVGVISWADLSFKPRRFQAGTRDTGAEEGKAEVMMVQLEAQRQVCHNNDSKVSPW